MATNKEKLKNHLAFSPRDKRLELEKSVEDEILPEDIEEALLYINELNQGGHSHSITEIGYSSDGSFYVKTQTGMTFIK